MKKHNLLEKATFAAIVFCMSIATVAAGTRGTKKQQKEEIPILAWYSIPAEETTIERYQELKDAGFTLNFPHLYNFNDAKKALDIAAKVGIKQVFMCNELKDDPEGTVKKIMNHPGLGGYFLRDEPVCNDFPELGAWAKKIQSIDNKHFCYLNLFPLGVSEEALGDTYRGYVQRFIKEVNLPLVSFDCYPVIKDFIRPTWYENLEIISEESRKANLPFWAFALSTAHNDYPIPTAAQLKLQMYSNLAYGAQVLQYFTYWNPGTETWDFHQAPITLEKKRSPVYNLVKEVNCELQQRAFVFVNSKVLSVNHVGDSIPDGTKRLENLPSRVKKLDTRGSGAVVSQLKKNEYTYLVVVNRSFLQFLDLDITFNGDAEVVQKDGTIENVNIYGAWYQAEPGEALIFRWKK